MGQFAGLVKSEIVDHAAGISDRTMNAVGTHGTCLDDSIMKYIFRLRVRMQYTFGNFDEFWLILNQSVDKNIAITEICSFSIFWNSFADDCNEDKITQRPAFYLK